MELQFWRKTALSEYSRHPKPKILQYLSAKLLDGVPINGSEISVEKPQTHYHTPSADWIAFCEEQELEDWYKNLSIYFEKYDYVVSAQIKITITDTNKLQQISKRDVIFKMADKFVLTYRIASNPEIETLVERAYFCEDSPYIITRGKPPKDRKLDTYLLTLIAESMAEDFQNPRES